MDSTLDAGHVNDIQLAEIIGPIIVERTLHVHESPESLTPTMSARHSKAQLVGIMIMLYFSVFLAALDTTITATALPTITQHFSSSAGYTWVGSAYLLATAASTPSWGKISDIFGRKPAVLTALGIFFLGSLLCGVSTSLAMLIAGRAVQGTGGGGLLILVIICTGDLFSPRIRGLVYGMESLIWAAAAALGPVLGGVFAELVDWRWCFYIALPCSGLAFIVLALFLELDTPSTPFVEGVKAIDWLGSIAIVGATLTLLLGLEFGGVIFAWSSVKVICLIIFGFVIGACFLLNEAKFARYPVMPLHLFHHRSNIAALLVAFLHGLTYFSASYYLPLYGQAVRGYGPLKSGLFVMPFEISLSISCAMTGILIRVTGRHVELIWFGLLLMTLAFGLFVHLDVSSTTVEIIPFQVLAGIGTGFSYSGPLLALQAQNPAKDNATVTSTYGFIRNLSMAISVVIGGVVFQNEIASQASILKAKLGSAIAEKLSGKEAAANVLSLSVLDETQKSVARAAYASSLRKMWILFTCTAACGFIISVFISKKALSKVHEETKTGLEKEERMVQGVVEMQISDSGNKDGI